MARGRDLILKTLENLEEEEFKMFKFKLRTWPLRENFTPIPRGKLSSLDRVDLSDKIVCHYLEDYGMELTAEVILDMGLREEAVALQQAARPASRADPKGNAAQSTQHSARACTASEVHFVDQHRTNLINRVTVLDPVLDELFGKVLNAEQYDTIRAEAVVQKQMRQLYTFMRNWNDACKDMFLEALRKNNPFLVEELEKS
ncbi:apoptosis-associated speck-like protein containing a CARD [Sarcophilus harrisii]|uniref:PYD and CARD domain containing n=1 Tax=Sarcophilus harrisii TaxID=9305 RepID=G3VLS4_SARHA|nr:apoptosis-associated speck-like protein containing a CARD [Sarcophilus harrisii]